MCEKEFNATLVLNEPKERNGYEIYKKKMIQKAMSGDHAVSEQEFKKYSKTKSVSALWREMFGKHMMKFTFATALC